MKKLIEAALIAGLLCAPAWALPKWGSVPTVNSSAMTAMKTVISGILDKQPVTMVVVPNMGKDNPVLIYSRTLAEAEHNATLSLLWDFGDRPDFALVERERLETLLAEMRLTYTGLLAHGVEPGSLAGVNYILFISEIGFETCKEFTYKLIELKTARIVAAGLDIVPD